MGVDSHVPQVKGHACQPLTSSLLVCWQRSFNFFPFFAPTQPQPNLFPLEVCQSARSRQGSLVVVAMGVDSHVPQVKGHACQPLTSSLLVCWQRSFNFFPFFAPTQPQPNLFPLEVCQS